MSDFLDSFLTFTKAVSGRNYPTIHLVLTRVFHLRNKIEELSEHLNNSLKEASLIMLEKFKKHFEVMPPNVIVAHILDPRCKAEFLKLLNSHTLTVHACTMVVEKMLYHPKYNLIRSLTPNIPINQLVLIFLVGLTQFLLLCLHLN